MRVSTQLLLLVAVLVAVGVCVPQSWAQGSISMSFGVAESFRPQLSRRDVAVIAKTLRLSEAEREAMDTLYEGYVGELKARSVEVRELVADVSEKAEAMRDLDLIGPARMRLVEWEKEAEKVQTQFMEDLKSLLTREQEARWPILERELRRLKRIGFGRLPGESVDLRRLTEGVLGEAAAPETIELLLEQYSVDVDRAIIARDTSIEVQPEFEELQETDFEKAKSLWENARRARRAVAEVNRRYVRLIGEALGPALGKKLDEAFFNASFGMLFEATRTERLVTAAAKLTSLDAAQRSEMDEIQGAYARELGAWRKRAAEAEEALIWESPPRALAVKMGLIPPEAGTSWRGQSLVPKDHPVNKTRAERYELDRRFRERVTKLLSEAQRAEIVDEREGQVSNRGHLPWGL